MPGEISGSSRGVRLWPPLAAIHGFDGGLPRPGAQGLSRSGLGVVASRRERHHRWVWALRGAMASPSAGTYLPRAWERRPWRSAHVVVATQMTHGITTNRAQDRLVPVRNSAVTVTSRP